MGIIYFISVITLMIMFLLWRKKEEKVNFLKYFVIAIVLEFCCNIVICYLMDILKISINLINISLTNLILANIMLANILKKKEIQKYYINKKDIFAFIIIILFVLTISYLRFGLPLEINYQTGDPAVHFSTTIKFVDSDKLVEGSIMPGAYINTGLIIKALSGIVDYFYYYKIFIIFDIFMWLIAALMMYVSLAGFSKTKVTHLMILAVTILYASGYPLNSLLFGFEYLSMSIILMNCIMCVVEEYKDKILKNKQIMLIMFLLETGISFTYIIFIPIIYGVTFLYLVMLLKKDILKKENIFGIFWILIVPFIVGAQFNILPMIPKYFIEDPLPDQETILALEGWIYRNLYSNIIVLLPISIIYLNDSQGEERSFSGILLTTSILAVGVTFIAFIFGWMSSYYQAKMYFMLWIVLMYFNGKGLIYLYNKKKLFAIGTLVGYILCVLLFLICRDIKVENELISSTEKGYTVAEIYEANKSFIKTDIKTDIISYNEEKIEILKYVRDNINVNEKTVGIVGEHARTSWAEEILKSPVEYISDVKPINLGEWIKNEGYDYVIYFTDSLYFRDYGEYILSNKEMIFENESGGILINN